MKQKLRRFMAGFLAILTMFTTLFTNGTTAFAASSSANISFWYASAKDHGVISEFNSNHKGGILYAMIDGHSAYCMNFGLSAKGGQLMNSDSNPNTNLSAAQEKLLAYCMYYGYSTTEAKAPTNDQCNKYIATQSMVWIIVNGIFGTSSADSAASKLCACALDSSSSYSYYETLRDKINASYNATRPSFASKTKSDATTYELKWNESNQRFEYTFTDKNGVLGNFDFSIDGFSVSKSGNSMTVYTKSVNTTATLGSFKSTIGAVDTTSSCVFWLTGNSGDQEFVSEQPSADPISAYIKVKTENIGYGEITKTDKSSGVHLKGAVYGIYSDSNCKKLVDTMTTDKNGYAKSKALTAGTYYVQEITAPAGYVRSDKIHTLTVKAGKTTGISLTDVEQLGSLTIYKEGEVLVGWNGSNFTYETRKLPGAAFKVTSGADIYKADGTKVYSKGDVIAENLVSGSDGQAVLSDLHLGTYVVTETKSIDGYTINTTPQTVKIEYKDQNVTVQAESTTIKNSRQKAEVSVVKKDSDTDNPLTGGQYTLYAGNDIKNYDGKVIVTKGAALQTVTTGADGKATYTVDLPISNSFYIAETKAPVNYVRNSDDVYSFNFNVMSQDKAKATFAHTFKNDRTTAKIQIFKVDKETGKAVPQGDAKLEGAVYGLYARENIVHPDGKTGVIFKAGDLVATLTTDAKGACSIDNLYLGKYYVKEITPSEGYLLDEEEHDVVCDYEGDLIPQVLRSTTSKEQVIKQPFQLIKAVATGNPMIKEKMEIDNDVQRLKLLKASYDSQRYSLQDNFMIRFPKLIKAAEEKLVCVREDLKARDAALLASAEFAITVGNVTFTERTDGGASMLEAVSKCKTGETSPIGSFKGFELLVEKNFMGVNYLVLRGRTEYKAELSTSPVGNMVKLENLFNGIDENIDFLEKKIESYKLDMEASKAEYEKPFAYEEELKSKIARQYELNAQLDLENGKVEDVDLAASEDKDIAQNVAEEKGPYRTGMDGYKR